MKRILWLAVIFFILIPTIGVFASSSYQSIDSQILNGSFESNPVDPTNGWDWPGNQWSWDSSIYHGGSHSVRIARSSGDETPSLWSAASTVVPSTIYTVSFWLRIESASKNPSFVIYQYAADTTQTGIRQIAYSNVGSGTQDWFLTSFRFQTMPDATQIRIRIYLYSDTTGTFWFDDINLDQVTPAIYPFSPGFPVEGSGWVYQSSPTIVDINNDGKNELLLGAGSSVDGWDQTGKILAGYPLPTSDRYIYNQLALADIDKDDRMEILAGTRTANPPEGQCHIFAWQDDGMPIIGWPKGMDWNPKYSNNDCKVTSIVLADIDNNKNLEVLASTTNNASGNPGSGITPENLYAWNPDGSLLTGNWPNKFTAAGFYGAIAAGDLNYDGSAEVIAARDHNLLNTYSGSGSSIAGWPVTTYLNGNEGDYQTDYRIVYGRSAPVLADLDNIGNLEYIVVGNVTGPGNSTKILNTALLVMRRDGTRYPGWEFPALGDGLLSDADMPQLSPAIGDINADGLPEIIVTFLDGWIRAYDLHKNQLWGFNYSQGAALFASEPVIGDINGDYALEIIFGTFVPIAGNDYGGPVGLWALDGNGVVTPGFPLPIPSPGVESAPTLADLDGDGLIDISAATIIGDIFVWDTPNPYYPARMPWPMGRHDLQRTGTYIDPSSFSNSHVNGSTLSAKQGDIASYSIHVSTLTPIDHTITVTNTLPNGLTYLPGTLTASSGIITEKHGVIIWNGMLFGDLSVDISYKVTVDTNKPQLFTNTVVIDTTFEGLLIRKAYLAVNTSPTFLPMLHR